jgi:hypothetical protein
LGVQGDAYSVQPLGAGSGNPRQRTPAHSETMATKPFRLLWLYQDGRDLKIRLGPEGRVSQPERPIAGAPVSRRPKIDPHTTDRLCRLLFPSDPTGPGREGVRPRLHLGHGDQGQGRVHGIVAPAVECVAGRAQDAVSHDQTISTSGPETRKAGCAAVVLQIDVGPRGGSARQQIPAAHRDVTVTTPPAIGPERGPAGPMALAAATGPWPGLGHASAGGERYSFFRGPAFGQGPVPTYNLLARKHLTAHASGSQAGEWRQFRCQEHLLLLTRGNQDVKIGRCGSIGADVRNHAILIAREGMKEPP